MTLTPKTSFVLDDGNGRAVGYCIGAADTASFALKWRDEFAPGVDPRHVPRPDVQTGDALMEKEESRGFRRAFYEAECSALQAWPEELSRYPAHMHINLLPEYQRKGWGSVLINALFDALRGQGAVGIHLGMVRSNTSAKSFYDKIGFQPSSLVLDGGKSGETGVEDDVLTMVKAL